ncbi:MAG: ABC transporter permease [Ilumatobacter sp.]|jgi:ABC-type polysaccharide/polyol phosphate export permease|uniref:ABC transporter permease n=1 Tax=Ilumatobacter sp. TaxID=1967498 RepID=UPI001D585CE5|nr:ABC transporter permease [Ilumatobacter sp.]MBT5275301.1 ABC transporter permease [Ilumatobacter sp.]MBT5554999.1 ABC transporter permease [Ilumatobacter sp.]MBT5866356.1 ABC transporter permease [Ilumatobacter sp.]MDC3331893.1 ABC transporter permease [Ilumatobacter sp.]
MSLRSAVAHRNLLYLLTLKELRTRYRGSILGWAWSLLNPISQMIIFSIIFLKVFGGVPPRGSASGVENFPLYFLSGLLPFQFFAISVGASIGSVQGGASLIKKVAFPHEHLVLSIVFTQFVTVCIELLVLSVTFLIFGSFMFQWLIPMAALLILIAIFTTGVSLALSAANVFFHDINYLWGIVAQLLFYASPIIFVIGQVPSPFVNKWAAWTPTGAFVTASHEILYDNVFPSLARWGYIAVCGIVAFAFGAWIFNRLSPRFAEEI